LSVAAVQMLNYLARRAAMALAAAAVAPPRLPAAAQNPNTSAMRVSWGPFKDLSTEQMDALDEQSKAVDAGTLLPSGVRVIDLVVGTGPLPQKGDRVWAHYKVWDKGFRSGPAADISFLDNRPYDWILGTPTDRIPSGADEGIIGMREGGWRRLVVPSAFDDGLRRVSHGPGLKKAGEERFTGPKAPLVIRPGAPAYFDVILMDGGSGRCSALLRPEGLSEREAKKLRSLTCSAPYEVY